MDALRLENLDPNILKQVKDKTIKELVHTGRETEVSRRKEEKDEKPIYSFFKINKKVKKYNKFFKEEDINIYLDVKKEENLSLKVLDRKTKDVIKEYKEEEVTDVLTKLDDMLGILVDQLV
ncbi:MAG: flagellar protein FlaG [Firmicutes bacterium]|nr:flagellar protein FlaG [Bacillota bacterium]